MYNKLILLITATIVLNVNAQMNNIFSLHEKLNKDIDIDVYFFQNGYFQIIMQETVTDDLINEIVISYGKYSVKNAQIVCRDLFNQFELKFNYKGDSIYLSESFNFIGNKLFFKNDFHIYEAPNLTKLGIGDLCEIRKHYKKYLPENYALQIGIYKNLMGFKLDIRKDDSYIFFYKNILISQGKWHQHNKELILYDLDMKHSFIVVIGNNELINLMFPWVDKFIVYKFIK